MKFKKIKIITRNTAPRSTKPAPSYGKFVYDNVRSKGMCPDCGRHGKWRYYVDLNGDRAPDEFGICDRVQECGHKAHPTYDVEVTKTQKKKKYKERVFIPPYYMALTLQANRADNKFFQFLRNTFGEDKAHLAFDYFRLGTMDILDRNGRKHRGACVFWTYNNDGSIEHGEVILVSARTGSTVKGLNFIGGRASTSWHYQQGLQWLGSKAFNKIIGKSKNKGEKVYDWFHAYCRQGDKHGGKGYADNYWGMHQLPKYEGRVNIVESCKTAVICWCHYGGEVWLATQSLNRLKAKGKDKAGKVRNIFDTGDYYVRVIPDGNAVHEWNPNLHESLCWGLFCNKFTDVVTLSDKCSPAKLRKLNLDRGSDIADIILKKI